MHPLFRILKHYGKKRWQQILIKKIHMIILLSRIYESCFPSIMALSSALAGLLPWASVTRSCLSHRFCQQDFLCCEPGAEGHSGPQCTNGVSFLPVPTNPCPVPSTQQDTCFPHTGTEKNTEPFLNKNCKSIVEYSICLTNQHKYVKLNIITLRNNQ